MTSTLRNTSPNSRCPQSRRLNEITTPFVEWIAEMLARTLRPLLSYDLEFASNQLRLVCRRNSVMMPGGQSVTVRFVVDVGSIS